MGYLYPVSLALLTSKGEGEEEGGSPAAAAHSRTQVFTERIREFNSNSGVRGLHSKQHSDLPKRDMSANTPQYAQDTVVISAHHHPLAHSG